MGTSPTGTTPPHVAPPFGGEYSPHLSSPLVDPRDPLPRWFVAVIVGLLSVAVPVTVAWTTTTRTLAGKEDAGAHAKDISALQEQRRSDSTQSAQDRLLIRETNERVRAIYCTMVPGEIRPGCR